MRLGAQLVLALATLLLLCTRTHVLHAAVPGRVLIVTSSDTTALIEEGLVRVRGEIAALGLAAELRVEDGDPGSEAKEAAHDFQGALVFERFGDWIRIQAWNPAAPTPVTQWIDTSDPSVDAEVVAVRAVEALRAALLPYLRSRSQEPEPAAQEASREATPAPIEPRVAQDLIEPPRLRRTQPSRGSFWLGPALGFDLGSSVVHLGAQVGFAYGTPWLLGAARFEATRAELPVRGDAGEVQVSRFAVLVDGRLRVPVLEQLDVHAAFGGGLLHHRVRGLAGTGYSGQNVGHTSVAFLLELGTHYWFTPSLGAYFSAHGTLATDAPVVRVDRRPIATLDRPELTLSSGMVLALD